MTPEGRHSEAELQQRLDFVEALVGDEGRATGMEKGDGMIDG